MIEAGAWTLVHFLWQGTLVWLLVSVQLRFLRQAHTRYVVSCAAMLLMLALPLATFIVLAYDAPSGMTSGGFASLSTDAPEVTSFVRAAAEATAAQAAWMPLLVGLWASGVGLFSLRNAGGLALAYLWQRRAVIAVPYDCHQAAQRLAARLGLRRTVRLRGSSAGVTPSVVGWLKPVIVIPAAALGLPFEQVEALLAHELAHIRRHDFLINLIQNVVETLLFYHPAVWWLGRRIREERENCCDDLAVAACGDRVIYVRALTSLAELRGRVPGLAVAATGGTLIRRVARLLGKTQPGAHISSAWLVAAIAVCGVVVLAGAALKAEEASTNSPAAFPRVVETPGQTTIEAQAAQAPLSLISNPRVEPVQAQPGVNLINARPSQAQTTSPATAAPSAGQVGTYIRQLAEAGYPDLSVDDLIAFKIHGITGDYARSMQAAGFKPSASDLVAMRIHNVTPEYAQALKAGGFANLTIDELVAARIHGVTPQVAEQLRKDMGAQTFDDVVAARIHGLTPEYIRSLKDAGFSNLTFDQAIAARIHGVDANTTRELREAGFANLDFDDVVAARIHGITGDFVRRAQQLGLKNLTFDQIVALKIHQILD